MTDVRLGLTDAQAKALAFIERSLKSGVSPSYREIADAMGWSPKTKSGVHRILTALENRGYIVWKRYSARSIALTPQPCPICQREMNENSVRK